MNIGNNNRYLNTLRVKKQITHYRICWPTYKQIFNVEYHKLVEICGISIFGPKNPIYSAFCQIHSNCVESREGKNTHIPIASIQNEQ